MVHRDILGESILVPIRQNVGDLESIYSMNETASRAWALIDGDRSLHEISDLITREFEVNQEQTDFVPFAQLTEALVIGWVQESLGEQGVANFEANVNGQLESQKNPPVSPVNTPLPWATPAAE